MQSILLKEEEIPLEIPKSALNLQAALPTILFAHDNRGAGTELPVKRYYLDTKHYLTTSEYQYIKSLLSGLKYKEIAQKFSVSVRSVEGSLYNAVFRFNLNSINHLIDYIKNNFQFI